MSRYERKFFIHQNEYVYLRSLFSMIGTTDSNSQKGSRYPIFTKYYDTESSEFYDQKLEGDFKHIKIRERSYSTKWDRCFPNFIEAKIKYRDEQTKIRVPRDQWGNYKRTEGYQYICELLSQENLTHTCNIYYEREAYEIPSDKGFVRINFDHNICALFPNELKMIPELIGSRSLDEGEHTLMEVKYSGIELPTQISHLLSAIDTKGSSFSKYMWGCDHLETIKGEFNDIG